MAHAKAALRSDEQVSVISSRDLVFQPLDTSRSTGIVFDPGALVDPKAEAPLAREQAQSGYLLVLPQMPAKLAVLAPMRATAIIPAYPEVEE